MKQQDPHPKDAGPHLTIQIQPPTHLQPKGSVGRAVVAPRSRSGKVAVIVCHGMGQQVPFETLDSVAEALVQRECEGYPESQPQVGVSFVRSDAAALFDPDLMLPRAEVKVTAPDGATTDVHLYEAYWAPLTEGQAKTTDVLKFLLNAGGWGILYSLRGSFQRYMFDRDYPLPIPRWKTLGQLIAAFAVVLSLVVIFVSLIAMAAARLLLGFKVPIPNTPLIDVLTGELIVLVLVLGVAAVVMLIQNTLGLADDPQTRRTGARPQTPHLLRLVLNWIPVVLSIGAMVVVGVLLTYSWVHLWNYSRLTGLDLRFERIARPNFGFWTKPFYLVFLITSAVLASLGRWYFVEYLGDVAAYVAAHKLDKFYELRHRIQRVALDVASAVYKARGDDQQFAYERIIMAGHSLGSVVIYDVLNSLINQDRLSGKPLRVADRTDTLLTFGSPLDKTAFVFRTQARRAPVREALAAAKQPLIQSYEFRPRHWINIWSRNDWISGPLNFYDPPGSDNPCDPASQRICNVIDLQATRPIMAHVQYWSNAAFRELLYGSVTGADLLTIVTALQSRKESLLAAKRYAVNDSAPQPKTRR